MGLRNWLARRLAWAAAWLETTVKKKAEGGREEQDKPKLEEKNQREKAEEEEAEERGEKTLEIKRLWDLVSLHEHTQAYHLVKVVGFEEWVDMEEILRRIEECFGVRYKNTRSLYPYIKTLVDLGFFEATSIGGRRRWRKKELLLGVLLKTAKARKKKKKAVAVYE